MNFYSVIIGTELLNGRRIDAHFSFLNSELLKRGWTHKGNFVIKDEPPLMEAVYNLIKSDKDSVMFSFGGIGATPDDYTRVCAANVFTNGAMEQNIGAKNAIESKFGPEAYPNRIKMADLPLNASLLKNVVTNVPGFYLEDRFFFVPGFPSMAKSMVIEALDKLYPINDVKTYTKTMSAYCSEEKLISTMNIISSNVDMSSLPIIEGENRYAIISISSNNENSTKQEFKKFTDYCEQNNIKFVLDDIREELIKPS
jgi:molybdopterin-biosynthesis enzyme MoeA-like protein